MEKKQSELWYLLPLILSIIGGLIGYLSLKNKDKRMAKNIFYVGLVVLAIHTVSYIIEIAMTYLS